MKISIVYHSESGNTGKIANIMADGAKNAGDVEVKCMDIDNIDEDFLNESKAVILGTPTYMGDFCWQIKKWLDTKKYSLQGKLGAVFATENFLGGGADVALLSLVGHLLVKGMVVYSSGCSQGQPYTHFGAVCIKDGDDFQQDRAKIYGERIAKKALELFA